MELFAELQEMVSEYNRCFDSTSVRDALIKQELIADTVKALNRQSLENAINTFLDIPSPVGLLVRYLESPWYRYYTVEINRDTGVMELQEDPQKAVRLSEIDRHAAQKVTNVGDWEKMLRALMDSCILYNTSDSAATSVRKLIPADELDSRLRWDSKRVNAGLQAVWTNPDKQPLYSLSAVQSQFFDVISAVFPSCFTDVGSPLRIDVPDAAIMRFVSACKPTTPGGKLRGEDELRFFSIIRMQFYGGSNGGNNA